MGLPDSRVMLCYIGKLTFGAMQNSKKSERNGRRARRRKSNNARKPTVLAQQQLLLMDSLRRTHHLKITHQVDQFNYHQLATSQEQQFPTSIRPRRPLGVFNNCRSMATTMLCSIQATQPRLMALQIRCITNVITPSILIPR
jgi:hypothetical protein